MKSQTEFKTAHTRCPSCDSVDVSANYSEPTPDGYYSDVQCDSCNVTYRIDYAVVSYNLLNREDHDHSRNAG